MIQNEIAWLADNNPSELNEIAKMSINNYLVLMERKFNLIKMQKENGRPDSR